MQQEVNQQGPNVRTSIKEFLKHQSEIQPTPKLCKDCGTACVQLAAQFWLDGDDDTFKIWLPFCPRCNPELLSRIPAAA
jgi:hypothetical protein